MVESFYATDFVSSTPYVVNSYCQKKFDEDHILVTVEHGAWCVLNAEEFRLLRIGKVEDDPNLFRELESRGIILTESNAQQVVLDYKEKKKFLFTNPTLHIITPTMRCNQHCVYCHSVARGPDAGGCDLDFATGKSIVDFILDFPVKSLSIEFQGGDFLLNYGVAEKIIDYSFQKAKEKKKRVLFSMVSNFTLMDESILKSLAERKIMGLSTSLDGPKEIHDKNRPFVGGAGSYDKVIHWIDRIKTEWKHNFNLNALCTVTKHSMGHEKEIIDEYLKHGFNMIWLRPLNNLGFAKTEWDEIGYTVDEFLTFWKNGLDYILEQNRSGSRMLELFSVIFLKKILSRSDPMMVDLMSPCGAAVGQLLYDYKGDIFTCDEGKIFEEFKLGNVKTSTKKDIFDNPTTISMVDISSKKNFLCDRCPWDAYCGFCPVSSYSAEGTIVSKIAMNDRCKLNAAIIEELFKRVIFSKEDRKIFFDWIKKDTVFS